MGGYGRDRERGRNRGGIAREVATAGSGVLALEVRKARKADFSLQSTMVGLCDWHIPHTTQVSTGKEGR